MKAVHNIFLLGFFLIALSLSSRAAETVLFGITNVWRYNQTSNFDGVAWMGRAYTDTAWPSGPGLLYSETNTAVAPRNTPLTLGRNTYYFRTHFTVSDLASYDQAVLTFSNKIDDGAVFYLNGSEIQRVRMPSTAITYSTFASSTPPGGDATGWDVFYVPATNIVVGDNVIAVEVHQSSATSSDIVFGSALSKTPMTIVRGPYLQSGAPNSVIVRWRTPLATDSVVVLTTNLAGSALSVTNSTVTADHVVTLTGLQPDTKYYYGVGSSAGILASPATNQFVVTSPIPGTEKPIRFWVLGDSGTADANAAAVRNAFYSYTGQRTPDLWLMLGDNAYNAGADAEFQAAVFDMYPATLRTSVLWPTIGNHDTAQQTNFSSSFPYIQIFSLPTNAVAGGMASGTEQYYSFDYANIHFVCLDSMTSSRATNGAMATWLRADLASTTNTWLVAYWHHPPYSKGSHDSDTDAQLTEMRQNILPILEANGVDLVLSGHSHSYERSYLLDGHYGLSTTLTSKMKLNAGSGRTNSSTGPYTKWTGSPAHQGAVYAVAGSSGQTSGGTLNHPAMYISLNQLGSMVIDVNGDRLDAVFLTDTATVADQFTIIKRDVEIAAESSTTGGFSLSMTNVAASKTNIVQATSDFANWVAISTNVVSSNSFSMTDAQATNSALQFYRVLRLP